MLSERPVKIRLSHLLIRARTPNSPCVFSCFFSLESNINLFSSPIVLCHGLLVLCEELE